MILSIRARKKRLDREVARIERQYADLLRGLEHLSADVAFLTREVNYYVLSNKHCPEWIKEDWFARAKGF